MQRYLLLAFSLCFVLTGCGMVAAFIPPLEVADPFGVEGETITTTFGGATSALQTQAKSTAEETTSRTFDDEDLDLRGFSLARLNAEIGIDPRVTLRAPSPAANFPDSFNLVHLSAVATLADSVHKPAVLTVERDLELLFVRDAASCDTVALTCVYEFSGDPEALAGALAISENDQGTLRAFVDIIVLDGQNTPNEGQFKLSVTADSEPVLDGFKASFTLRSGDATIKLGG